MAAVGAAVCIGLFSAEPSGAQALNTDPINTIPGPGASFLSDLQGFLRQEDGNRYAELWGTGLISTRANSDACIGATGAGLTHTPTACVAYVDGLRVTETGSITYTDNAWHWVIIDQDISGDLGAYTRVGSTHYLVQTTAADVNPPALPSTTLPLMRVVTSGGSITEVHDRRPAGPSFANGLVYNAIEEGFVADADLVSCATGTDNTAAFNRLLTKIRQANRAALVFFPQGRYRVDSTITLNNLPATIFQGNNGYFVQDADAAGTTPDGTVFYNCTGDALFHIPTDPVPAPLPNQTVTANLYWNRIGIHCDDISTDIGIRNVNGRDEGWFRDGMLNNCLRGLQFGDATVVNAGFNYLVENTEFRGQTGLGTGIWTDPRSSGAFSLFSVVANSTFRTLAVGIERGGRGALIVRDSFFEGIKNSTAIVAVTPSDIDIQDSHWENNGDGTGTTPTDIHIVARGAAECIAAGGSGCSGPCTNGATLCCQGGSMDQYVCGGGMLWLRITDSTMGSNSGGGAGEHIRIDNDIAVKSVDFVHVHQTNTGEDFLHIGRTDGTTTVHVRGGSQGAFDFCQGGACSPLGAGVYNGAFCTDGHFDGTGVGVTRYGCTFPNGAVSLSQGFVTASATPSVAATAGVMRVTANVAITNLLNGEEGQCVSLYADNASGFTVPDTPGVIENRNDRTITVRTDEFVEYCQMDDGIWYERDGNTLECDENVTVTFNPIDDASGAHPGNWVSLTLVDTATACSANKLCSAGTLAPDNEGGALHGDAGSIVEADFNTYTPAHPGRLWGLRCTLDVAPDGGAGTQNRSINVRVNSADLSCPAFGQVVCELSEAETVQEWDGAICPVAIGDRIGLELDNQFATSAGAAARQMTASFCIDFDE